MKYKIILYHILAFSLILVFTFQASAIVNETESLRELTERYNKLMEQEENQSVSDFLKNEPVNDTESYDFSDEYKKFSDSIPTTLKDSLPFVDSFSGGTLSSEEIIAFDITDNIKALAKDNLSSVTNNTAVFIAILILSFILNSMIKLWDSKLQNAASMVVCIIISLQFFYSGIINTTALEGYIESLTKTTTTLVSLMVSVLIAGGNITTATVASSSVSLICTLIQHLFSHIVMPLISLSLALSVAGVASGTDFISKLSDFLRKLATWITIITVTAAGFTLSIQNILAKSADTVGIKTIKFAVGSFVPIVGGALSETVNTVTAGLSYIKNTAGAVGIVVLILIILPPIVQLFGAKITLFIARAFASLTDCKNEEKILTELSGVTDCLLALFICSSASFTVFIIGLISARLAIGG